MTKQEAKSRKLLAASIGLVMVADRFLQRFTVYRVDQQRQAGDAHALIDEGIAQFRAEQYELSLQTLGSIPEGLGRRLAPSLLYGLGPDQVEGL